MLKTKKIGIGTVLLFIVVISITVYYFTYEDVDTTSDYGGISRDHPRFIQTGNDYLPILIDRFQLSLDECEYVESKEEYSHYMKNWKTMTGDIERTLPNVSQIMFMLKNGDYIQNPEIGSMLEKYLQLESDVNQCIDHIKGHYEN